MTTECLLFGLPDEEPEMRPENPMPELAQRTSSSRATAKETRTFTEAVARAGWSMQMHALLGEQVAHAVSADILTLAEAEILLTRLAAVIDQAVGAGEN